jgi:uroporphyrinogen decarboxylase
LEFQAGHTWIYDVIQQLAQPEDALLDRYQIDALDIGRAFNTLDVDWNDFKLPQGLVVQFPSWFKPVKRPSGARDVFDREANAWTACRRMPPFSIKPAFRMWMAILKTTPTSAMG